MVRNERVAYRWRGPGRFDEQSRFVAGGRRSFFNDVAWPVNAREITFDYMFREPTGGEYPTVHLGDSSQDVLFYSNSETSLARGTLTSSGPYYVGDAAGTTSRLNFVLRTDEEEGGIAGGSVVIDNIKVFGLVDGDVDLDGDVDVADFAVLQTCFVDGEILERCWALDLDERQAIDLVDYAEFMAALRGPVPVPTLRAAGTP